MPLIDAYRSAWSRSFEYEGRSNRAEFWWFVLANLIVSVIIALISAKLQTVYTVARDRKSTRLNSSHRT